MNTINPNPPSNFSQGSPNLKVQTDPIQQSVHVSKTPTEEEAVVSIEDPVVKERYHQLMNDALVILTQTSFTEKDSMKLQAQLNELNTLQKELKTTTTQSLRSLNEILSAAYSKVTGEDFNHQEISPDILEQVVKTPVMLENQFQSTTMRAEAQKIMDEELLNNLQNQLEDTQKMVDNLNAQIAKKIELFGPDGDGNEATKEIEELKEQISQLKEQNQILTDELNAAQANIATQQQISTYLQNVLNILNTHPIPPTNSQAFCDLFNQTIQSRDQLQTLLNHLDKNDPSYPLVEKALNDLLVAYPYATYPAGTTATTTVTSSYTKKSDFDALIAKAYYKDQLTPAFISNFIKFINGDPTATRPILNGQPMNDELIKTAINIYFDATPNPEVTVINIPGGGTIDSAVATQSLSDLKGANLSQEISQAINANQSNINSNQAIINHNQAIINANTQELATKEPHLQELLNAQMAKINELMNNNKELKEVIERLNGILTSDPSNTTTFSLSRLIACLIDLCQVMQKMAAAETARLAIVTKKMSAYSKLLLQIPVLTSKDTGDYNKLNPIYANAQEGVRINKTAEEDLAKQIQSILQSLKDASQSVEDFIGTILNMMASISQKISR